MTSPSRAPVFTEPALEGGLPPGLELVPAWAAYPWLRAAFSTRANGASQAYGPAEQNLGWTAQDQPQAVATNRKRFLEAVYGDKNTLPLVTVRQTHGSLVQDLDDLNEADTERDGRPTAEADGLLSAQPGKFLGILTADCVPILVADTRTHAVAAFHAGWRGTLARIVELGVQQLQSRHGSRAEDLTAAIGPAIRPCCFEVGAEIQSAFAAAFPYASELFTSQHQDAKRHLDLQEANRRQLRSAGLLEAHIHTIRECTACCRTPAGRRKYFSYRAEGGITGRMLSVIGTTAP